MAKFISVRGFTPKTGKDCFIAETAVLIGDVIMGDHGSVWFNAVIRGDVNSIRIGDKVNIQDGAVIHGTYKTASTTIGNRVSIAHNAVVHGCTIHDNVLIGMGAIIMDSAVIESNTIIGAGAVIPQNFIAKSGGIYGGVPAQRIKEINEELLKGQVNRITDSYGMYAGWYQE